MLQYNKVQTRNVQNSMARQQNLSFCENNDISHKLIKTSKLSHFFILLSFNVSKDI